MCLVWCPVPVEFLHDQSRKRPYQTSCINSYQKGKEWRLKPQLTKPTGRVSLSESGSSHGLPSLVGGKWPRPEVGPGWDWAHSDRYLFLLTFVWNDGHFSWKANRINRDQATYTYSGAVLQEFKGCWLCGNTFHLWGKKYLTIIWWPCSSCSTKNIMIFCMKEISTTSPRPLPIAHRFSILLRSKLRQARGTIKQESHERFLPLFYMSGPGYKQIVC